MFDFELFPMRSRSIVQCFGILKSSDWRVRIRIQGMNPMIPRFGNWKLRGSLFFNQRLGELGGNRMVGPGILTCDELAIDPGAPARTSCVRDHMLSSPSQLQ